MGWAGSARRGWRSNMRLQHESEHSALLFVARRDAGAARNEPRRARRAGHSRSAGEGRARGRGEDRRRARLARGPSGLADDRRQRRRSRPPSPPSASCWRGSAAARSSSPAAPAISPPRCASSNSACSMTRPPSPSCWSAPTMTARGRPTTPSWRKSSPANSAASRSGSNRRAPISRPSASASRAISKLWREKRATVLDWFDKTLMSYDHDTGLAATWATSVDRLTPDAPPPARTPRLSGAGAGPRLAARCRRARRSPGLRRARGARQPLRLFARLARGGRGRQDGAGRFHRASSGAGFRAAEHDGGATRRGDAGGAGMGKRGVRRRSAGRPKLAGPRPARAACAGGRAAGGRGGDRRADGAAVQSACDCCSTRRRATREAEPLYRRALAIDEASYGPDHPNVAIRLNNLAGLLQATNRLGEAEPLYRRALAIDEASYGPDHPEVATDLNNLAGLLRPRTASARPSRFIAARWRSTRRATGRIIPTWRATSTISRVCFKPRTASARPSRLSPRAGDRRGELRAGSSQCGRHLNNLAFAPRHEPPRRGRAALSPRAGDRRGELGPDHPTVATDLNNLAQFAPSHEPPRRGRAALIAARSRSTRRATGRITPTWRGTSTISRALLQATNRLGEAEPLYRRALTIDEASYGPDHPEVATDLNNLAGLLYATNRLGEAEPLFRRALAIDEASYGPDHPNVARDLNNLAELLRATNRLGEAEPLYRRALAIVEASYGPDHPQRRLLVRKNLAALEASRG